MKPIRLAIAGLILLIVFIIYLTTIDKKIYYISIGDSFSAGQNPYGKLGYGYSDYVANYLETNKLLEFYTKDFSEIDYRTKDLISSINNNKKIKLNNKMLSIKTALIKADLVTVSIGIDELFSETGINDMSFNLSKTDNLYNSVDLITSNIEKTIILLKKYCKEDIVIIGCYNPLSRVSSTYLRSLEPVFIYMNNKIYKLAERYHIHYVNVYDIFKENPEYIPNPNNVHPSTSGYEVISSEIINIIEKNIIN
jgi:lysophospholipase L1-like esterase